MLECALDEVKQRLWWGLQFIDLVGKVAVGGKVAEIENPDDAAAAENVGTGVAFTWACVCHAQLGNPFE